MSVQNGSILAASSTSIDPAVQTLFRCQDPAEAMAWTILASNCSKTPLVFIDDCVKVTTQAYAKKLEEHVLPWVPQTY